MYNIEHECNTPRFELFTSEKSVKNIRLYERLGYVRFKEKKIADGLIFVYMEKSVNVIDVNALHTTDLGVERIRRNLGLDVDDVVAWCKQAVLAAGEGAVIRRGKNWYVSGDGFILTINTRSNTVITAYKSK